MGHDHLRPAAAGSPPTQFERHLMGAYLAGAGHEADAILARTDEHARQLVVRASAYASEKVCELHVRQRQLWTENATATPHLYE